MLSYIYNPDAGLYHYPYVNILNDEKIIFGLSNLHFRFGHISIIQYTSAFFNNFLFNLNGIVIPLASLASFIILNFLFKIFESVKKQEINFHIIFLTLILIYIAYKMNRYSEYGNDAPAHFLFFYLVSEILQINKKEELNKKKFNLLLISIFIFLNKTTMGLAILMPLIFIKLKNLKSFNNLNFCFSILFLTLWLLKNLLISSCLIYPIKITCTDKLEWTNTKQTSLISTQSESWSKGWPDRKNKEITFNEFNKNFNWFNAWSSKHLKKINKILLPYLLFLSFFYLFVLWINKNTNYKNKEKPKYKINSKVNFVLALSLCGTICWFLKFPIYRYGYSYIIISVAIFFAIIIYKQFIYFKFLTQKKIILTLVILSFSVLVAKQTIRIIKNYENNYQNYPWPKYFSYSKTNKKIKTVPININGKLIYKSDTMCMYSNSPCSSIPFNIQIKKKNKYLILNTF